MKKLMLGCVIGSIALLSACGEDKKEVKEESAPTVQTVDTKGLKIAFYYSDSLKTGFKYYAQEDARMTKKGQAFQNEMMSRQRKLEEMAATYEKFMREGTVTGQDLQKLENDIMTRREQLMALQQNRGAALEKETNEALEVLSKKIEAAGKKYCKKYGIDLLLIHGAGGQINFVSEKMNATKSFIEFLNAEQQKTDQALKGE